MVTIAEYDDVDPLAVLALNLTGLNFALTPERAAAIRKLDRRPFPFFAIYAVENGVVMGQVAVYRLPLVTPNGREDVGGVCAVCTNPASGRQGIATRLLDEAHARMRADGLRFSTLGTSRHRVAHTLYKKHGYADVFAPVILLIQTPRLPSPGPLCVRRAENGQLNLADELFHQAAAGWLGFAWRHASFLPMLVATGELGAGSVWLVWQRNRAVGYILADAAPPLLTVHNILLVEETDAGAALAALAHELDTPYLQVRVDQPPMADSLRSALCPAEWASWSTFMVKPLTPEVTVEDARRLFGVDAQRFLCSAFDIT
ncbi:MAG: GNAT family N-acetyltransferase [Caldilineaceae bacterium]|nr:GNAT family N-acetyltransferase [Caldilineaceae bacterium]